MHVDYIKFFENNRCLLEAVLTTLAECREKWVLVTSKVISHELNAITSIGKREKVLSLLSLAREHVTLTPDITSFVKLYGRMEWIPIMLFINTCALSAGAALVTADDALIKNYESSPGSNIYSIQSCALVQGA